MRIDKIGFGYVKNLGGYENCKLYLEATIEPWEDPTQSLDLLRTKVAEELDLPEGWRELRYKYNQEVAALRNIENTLEVTKQKLARAEEAWDNYKNFLVAHGINPELLKIDAPLSLISSSFPEFAKVVEALKSLGRQELTGLVEIDNRIESQKELLPLSKSLNIDAVEEDDDDYFAYPDYGNEDDYLHDHAKADKSENLYL